jgi:hypothetical protein
MITDDQARDALILHLERSVKENRMLLRDQFAIAALASAFGSPEQQSKWAYKIADAMLEARKQ